MRTLFAAAVLLLPSVALAQDEKLAAQHFEQGTRAFDAHDYARAAVEFEAANNAKPAAPALLAAGLSWEFAGDLLRSASDLTAALAAGLEPSEDAKAREHLASIDGRVGHLEIVGPVGARARVDGREESPVPLQLRVVPGDHIIEGRMPDGSIEPRKESVRAGASLRIDLTVVTKPQPPPRAPESQPEERPATPLRTVGWIGIGAGAATLVAGAIVGVVGLDANHRFDDSGWTNASLRDEAVTTRTIANVLFVGAAALTVAGLVLVFVGGPKGVPKAAVAARNGARLGVPF